MKAVVQRVSGCSVEVENRITGKIDRGLLIYLGIGSKDQEREIDFLINKIINLRIFADEHGKMNLSIRDIKGEILVVSQFTLFADLSKGRRPSFNNAAPPEIAIPLYELLLKRLREQGISVECGIFGASMKVRYCNDGPVTILIDTEDFYPLT